MIDYSDEYKYWDQTESVTVTVLVNEGGVRTESSVPVAIARRGSREQNESVFNGITLDGNETFWLIPYALMGGTAISRDHVIRDGNNVEYKVKTARLVTKGASKIYYRCATIEVRP